MFGVSTKQQTLAVFGGLAWAVEVLQWKLGELGHPVAHVLPWLPGRTFRP